MSGLRGDDVLADEYEAGLVAAVVGNVLREDRKPVMLCRTPWREGCCAVVSEFRGESRCIGRGVGSTNFGVLQRVSNKGVALGGGDGD